MVEMKWFRINFWASFISITMIVIQIFAELLGNKVIYDWSTVTMYIALITGAGAVLIGTAKMTIDEIKQFMDRNRGKV